MSRRWHRLARRWVAALVVLGSLSTGVVPAAAEPPPDGTEPEIADWWDNLTPSTPDDDPVAPPVEPTESAPLIEDEPFAPSEEVASGLPDPGTAELTLGGVGVARQAGDLPLELAAESSVGRGRDVRVEVLNHEVAARAGVRGFAFRLTGGDGAELTPASGGELPASLEVDYSGFDDLYGAGYADRLRVVVLPECALADPVPEGCDRAGTLLPSDNDRPGQRLIVELGDLAAVQGPASARSGDADGSVASTTPAAGSAGGGASSTTAEAPVSAPAGGCGVGGDGGPGG